MSNPITSLHNYLQNKGEKDAITYEEVGDGPTSQRVWTVYCKIRGVVKGTGQAGKINEAKHLAAQQALAALKAAE